MPTDTRIEKLYKNEVSAKPGYRKLTPDGFVPAAETVLVRRHSRVEMTDGGIHLPDSAQEESVTGEVVAVAEDEDWLKVGDTVLIDLSAAENPASRPFANDRDLVVLHCYRGRESDILGKFRLTTGKR